MPSAAQRLPDLTGEDFSAAERVILEAGFSPRSRTRGGYIEFRHPDGSKLWVRPTGELVRMGPKVQSTMFRRFYNPRFDQHGKPTELHSTGEVLGLGR